MEFKFGVLLAGLFLVVNGDLLSSFRSMWYTPPPHPQGEDEGVSKSSFSARSGGYDDPYFSSASSRQGGGGGGGGGGWGWGGGGGGWGWPGHGHDHQNLDLYSLLGGLSFASLLGATIIYLARRNTAGRRRRSADGLSYLEEDEFDFSEDPNTKGLNIVELIDTFLDNNAVFTVNNSSNKSSSSSSSPTSSWSRLKSKVNLGPGVIPHQIK